MQAFGPPGHLIRSGRAASRLLAAKPPNGEAGRRRDAVTRRRAAMAQGLIGEQAASGWARLAPPSVAGGRAPNPAAVGRAECASPIARAAWQRRSSGRASIIPSGQVARPCKRAAAKNAADFLEAVLKTNARSRQSHSNRRRRRVHG